MKKISSLILVAIILFSYSCGGGRSKNLKDENALAAIALSNLPPDEGFSEFISSYTSGVMPANGVIEVRISPEFATTANRKNAGSLFTFSPSIKGNAEWVDDYTIVFKPSKILPSGTLFSATFDLGKIGEVPERLKIFPFRIQTLKKDFKVTIGALESELPEGASYTMRGELVTSDFMPSGDVESLLQAKLGKRSIIIEWEHPENGNTHLFKVQKIVRGKEEMNLNLEWDGAKSGIKEKGSESVNIPSIDDFYIRNVTVSSKENQRIDIELTDPLDPSQELEGLVYLSPRKQISFDVAGNRISVFPAEKLSGEITVIVDASVRSRSGVKLKDTFKRQLNFTTILPGIKEVGSGVIIPASTGLILPFRAANLSAVDLTIIKIFSNNIPYFLQMNTLTGASYIRQFGRPVYKGKVDLLTNSTTDPNNWNLFTINIADFIAVEPGIIYRVELGMRRSYSLYPCSADASTGNYEKALDRLNDSGFEWWDNSSDWYEDGEEALFYEFAYDWRERENPCSDAYYTPYTKLKKNLIATNIGLIAKMGGDDIVHAIVTDINTADPMADVNIEVFDLQMQSLGSVKTNKDGFASLSVSRKPFLMIASTGNDRNYLRLDDGNSLSLSSFDVAGVKPQEGMKVYIYGERDVWRPGDSIFLSLFIKELNRDIPQDHPVQMELLNPTDQKVDFQVQSIKGRNLLVFKTKTSEDAVTGSYNAVFRIGGATFTKRVRIETVKPNRLKINLSFDAEILGGGRSGNSATLNARWLSGAVSGSLKSSVEMLLKPVKTEFEKYSQYNFDYPGRQFYSETETIFDGTLDSNGDAKFKLSPSEIENAPGMLMANITTRVFEKGGDASITQTGIKYAPYPVFVGINLPGLKGTSRMLFTDASNDIKLVTVNHLGRPVRADVNVSVYKLSYRWWWESNEESLGYYVNNNYYKPVFKETVTTSLQGEGGLSFSIPAKEWGRYLIVATASTGHSTGKVLLIDWPWESGAKSGGGGEAATVLALNTDKEKYNTGEDISISFPSPKGARAIVSIENASGIIDNFRVETVSPNTTLKIKALPSMAPNAYVYVSVIQPHAQTINDIPVRMYGIVPLMVEDPATRLNPQLEVPAEVRSERKFEVKVSEAGKRPMSYSLAVVDEGLLDITGYKTPNPWNYFYAREALGVKTWDIYDYVLGAFGATLEKVFAIGGDDAFLDQASRKARRFEPVIKFLGPFTLEGGKTNTHAITLAQYTGSVRVMVVAGNSRSFGSAERSVIVKDPLMLLATAPRVLSPGEKVTLPLSLFVLDEKIRTVNIKAESNELIRFTEPTKVVTVEKTGEKEVELSMVVSEKLGRGTMKITAEAGGETAVYSIEIEIRSPNPKETRSELKILKEGESLDHSFNLFGMTGTNSARVEVTSLPPVNLEKRLGYLTGYPHGCTEQITSSAFPQLYLKDVMAGSEIDNALISKNIQKAIQGIAERQMAGGGLSLWPGAYQPDTWVTSYAGHFMIEAGRKGYNIPSSFMSRWTTYQKKAAQEWRYDAKYRQTAIVQAYRLYTLALSGNPEKGAMNRLRETAGIPRMAGWMLAGAFAVTGRPEAALDIIDMRLMESEPELQNYFYGSPVRDKAIILHTLLLLKNEEQATLLLKEIADKLSSEGWYSTQSTAWGLFSYMKYIETFGGSSGAESKFSITVNGEKSNQKTPAGKVATWTVKNPAEANSVKLTNNSSSPLFVNLITQGVPMVGDASRENRNLSVKVEYNNMEGLKIDHSNLKQGTDFMMVVSVTNNSFSPVSNIALTNMMPSGWEIRNTRLFEANFGVKESSYDYRDFRDDRVYTYFGLKEGETRTFVILLNAAYRGEYFQPAIWCEAMYEENYYSRIPGGNVKVTGVPVE